MSNSPLTGRIALALLLLTLAACGSKDPPSAPARVPVDQWPMYGHDAQHTFHSPTTLTKASVKQLARRWYFATGDAVTATPTVVDGTVYVGSWDTNFYAIDLRTGRLRWKRRLDQQHGVTPYPGQHPRDYSSDGGLVTSSATYLPAEGDRPALVIFAGGYTLYALAARTGRVYWKHRYTGRPERPPDPAHDNARIFSSPTVVDGKVIVALTVDGQDEERGYVVAADLETGKRVWTYETDVARGGRIRNDGCGNVWASGTLLPDRRLVVFDESDCDFRNTPPTAETVFALHVDDGHLAWRFKPKRPDPLCDFDFGATANAGIDGSGRSRFLGVGSKDGTYYSLDPATGRLRWSRHVVFGGFSGGFIATAAYDGRRVYGSTALGDFGRFETNGPQLCDPKDPQDKKFQEPTVHAFDARTGRMAWSARGAASFAPTTVAGGMTFNGLALHPDVQVRDAGTGALLKDLTLPNFCWSGIAIVGDAVVLGTGSSASGGDAGVALFTPGGRAPAIGHD